MTTKPITMQQDNVKNSTGNQIGNQYNYSLGLDYKSTKDLFNDLISSHLEEFKEEAKVIAEEKNKQLMDMFMNALKLHGLNDTNTLAIFKNPSMQLSYIAAQKANLKNRSPILQSTLVDLLIFRIAQPDNELINIVLSEAIKTAPLLTEPHFQILALVFKLKYCGYEINSFDDFLITLKRDILPYISPLPKITSANYQHLDYANVASISLANYPLENILGRYNKVFPSDINEHNLKNHLIVIDSGFQILFDTWNNTTMNQLQLTSVGIALAITFIQNKESLPLDINIWIN